MKSGGKPKNLRVGRIRLLCLLVGIAFGFGLWLHWPYLKAELERQEPWKIAGLYFSDIAALLYFLRFVLVRAVLGRPPSNSTSTSKPVRLKLLAIGCGIVLLIDLGFSLYLMLEANIGYRNGSRTHARVHSVQVHKREDATWYETDSDFTDGDGVQRHAHLRVQAKGHMLPSSLPLETAQVLTDPDHSSRLVAIRYDVRFPCRAWLDGAGWEDGNEIYWVSIACLMLQAGLTLLFLLFLAPFSGAKALPSWWELYKMLPLAAESFVMLGMGLIDLVMDKLN